MELQKGYYKCNCRITHIDYANKIAYVEFLDREGNAVLLKDIEMDVARKVLRYSEDELKEREKNRCDYSNWYRII